MLKRTFDEDLDRAVAFHGHLCGGQIIGDAHGPPRARLLPHRRPQYTATS